MRITGTFLDDGNNDIPSQNWGRAEWDRDFAAMRRIGIDTVILIRGGIHGWLNYPSRIMQEAYQAVPPPVDLVRLFLELAERHGMRFFFPLYRFLDDIYGANFQKVFDTSRRLIDEAWASYGAMPAFKGWYLPFEISRKIQPLGMHSGLGRHCKAVSNGLPVLISPGIDGVKNVWAYASEPRKHADITPEKHAAEWDAMLPELVGGVDVVTFQDGHVDYRELPEYLAVNKRLADRHGLTCWTNTETFDRDKPIKFMPIAWDKLLFKLNAAAQAGIESAITFEFSHFMSPNACYPQAHGLYARYREHLGGGTTVAPGAERAAVAD